MEELSKRGLITEEVPNDGMVPAYDVKDVDAFIEEVAKLDGDAKVALASALVPLEQPKYPEVERLKLLFNRQTSASARGNILSRMVPMVRQAIVDKAQEEWLTARELGEM